MEDQYVWAFEYLSRLTLPESKSAKANQIDDRDASRLVQSVCRNATRSAFS
jgi:hypothetical protein